MNCKISDRNSKLGKVPNVSLAPIETCDKNLPCYKSCYAMKSYRLYPSTKNAWNNNTELARTDLDTFFGDIHKYIDKKKKPVPFFRWHVGGDILNEEYFLGMVQLAIDNPQTIFLAFTKKYHIVNEYSGTIPANFTIVFSAWPGLDMDNPDNYPIAWMQDGTETRVPDKTLECPGNCETCGMCFQIDKIGMDVCFHKH